MVLAEGGVPFPSEPRFPFLSNDEASELYMEDKNEQLSDLQQAGFTRPNGRSAA